MRLILDGIPVLFLLFFVAVSVTLLVIPSQAICTLWDITWRGFFLPLSNDATRVIGGNRGSTQVDNC
jgi:hypothetical protein